MIAQDDPTRPPDTEPVAKTAEPNAAGDITIAISPALQENLLRRVVLDLSDRYALSDDQTAEITNKLLPRWKGYLAKEKDRLAPVLSELLEMRLALEPPSEEQVADWSQRAAEVFDSYLTEVGQASGEIRESLSPEQRLRFDADLMQMKLGLGLLRTQLQQGASGTGEGGFWDPPPGREQSGESDSVKRDGSKRGPLPLDPVERELLLWQAHVDEFAARYKLDEGQRDAAASVLVELSGRAVAHRDRNRAEIAKLENAIESNDGSEESIATIRQDVVRLYGPVDALFEELETRLRAIPSDKQKEAATSASPGQSTGSPKSRIPKNDR